MADVRLTAGDPSSSFSPALPLAPVSTPGLPVVPIQQIRAGRLVEMRDLMPDNILVRSHFEELNSLIGVQLLPVSSRPRVGMFLLLLSGSLAFFHFWL